MLDTYLAAIGDPRPVGAVLRRGQFHDVVVTATTVYRFPRTESGRQALPQRARVLAALAEARLGFAVPVPWRVHSGYLAASAVPGLPLTGDADVDLDVVAGEMARVLGALAAAAADDRLRDRIPVQADDHWHRFADDVTGVLFPLMSEAGRQRAGSELAAVRGLPVTRTAVVHGDLGGANLLWDHGPPPRLTGVLDWDGVSIGDPAADVASVAATYGWGTAERAARLAGTVDAALLVRARTIEATFALQQALPAALSGDHESLADGLAGYVERT